jgi:hypothetical protein
MAENPYHEAIIQGADGRMYQGRLVRTRTAVAAAAPETPAKAATPAPAPAPPPPRSDWTARLVAILRLPAANTRPRQALAWALETSITPDAAAKLLATLPTDAEANIAHGHRMLPSGAVALPPDAARIASILRSPEAGGREAQALTLALEGLPAATARQLLASMNITPAVHVPTIAERAAGEAEFGGEFEESFTGTPAQRRAARIDSMWKQSAERHNAGFKAPATAGPAVTPDNQE